MRCQNCKKNEATVRYMENINGKKQELHLCYKCANKLGFADFNSIFSPMLMGISDIFQTEVISCPNCSLTFDDYAKSGLFGCPECYSTFENEIDEMLLRIQDKNRHIQSSKLKVKNSNGAKSSPKTKLEKLKDKLQQLIKEEKYEEAAIIRDEIKKVEG